MQSRFWFYFSSRNVAGQWNQVFVQPLPEEEVTVRHDQDPRVSRYKIATRSNEASLPRRRTLRWFKRTNYIDTVLKLLQIKGDKP